MNAAFPLGKQEFFYVSRALTPHALFDFYKRPVLLRDISILPGAMLERML